MHRISQLSVRPTNSPEQLRSIASFTIAGRNPVTRIFFARGFSTWQCIAQMAFSKSYGSRRIMVLKLKFRLQETKYAAHGIRQIIMSVVICHRSSESNRQSPPCPETNEDTITAHSRRRAKFLQLFLQRASLNQPRVTHLASQPSLGPTRGDSMEHWTKPDQLSQSINLLNMTSASWRLNEAHHSSSSFEARYLSETGADPVGRESMRRLNVGTHSGSIDRHRTFAQDELLNNVNVPTIKKIHYLPRNYYSAPGSKHRRALFSNKGQTPSETEYDRINSDVGSEVDSSSGPEEIPVPTVIPNSPGNTKLNNWLTEVNDLAVRSGSLSVRPVAPNMTKEADQFGKRPSVTKVRVSGRRPHGLSKRKHSLRPVKSLFTNRSSEGSTESRDTADAWMEQEQSSDSAQSDKHPMQPDVSLSNAEEMSKLAHNVDSMPNGIWPETLEDHLFQSPQSPFPMHRRAPSEKHNYPSQVSD
ncbi:hypothetical protein AHF37_03747 [Paragonimus kellicotti]|nr:hypothetical protein AHF37_03747 [Paragonimus kellicotti]